MTMQFHFACLLALFSAAPIRAAPDDALRASGRMKYGAEEFPAFVDLSAQLAPLKQQYFGSCHVYGATNLLEAACYRKTGKRVDLSEEYLFYRHLRSQLSRRDLSMSELKSNPIGGIEGGFATNSLERVLQSGNVCTEEETTPLEFFRFLEETMIAIESKAKKGEKPSQGWTFGTGAILAGALGAALGLPLDWIRKDLAKAFGPIVQCRDGFSRLKDLPWLTFGISGAGVALGGALAAKLHYDQANAALLAECNDSFCQDLDQAAKEIFHLSEETASGGRWRGTTDKDLLECLSKEHELVTGKMDEPTMLRYLSAGYPIECGGHYNFGGGLSGPHSAVVVGYKVENGQILYQTKNAHGRAEAEYFSMHGCNRASILL